MLRKLCSFQSLRILMIFVLCAFVLWVANSWGGQFSKGETLNHMLSVCIEKDDAIAIVRTHATKGKDAALAIWSTKDGCASIPVVGPKAGEIVYTASVKDGDSHRIAQVIEIIGPDGKLMGYFLAYAPLKSESNS